MWAKKPLCKSMQLKPHKRQASPGEQNSSDEDDGTKSGQDEQTQSNFKIDTVIFKMSRQPVRNGKL